MTHQFSYWEKSEILNNPDFLVVGSGIVGLSTAISIKERAPDKNVLVIERGILPTGGSTKNAGFCCFGSPSELIDDLETMDENKVFSTVEKRYKGLSILLERLGKTQIDYFELGSHELFTNEDKRKYNSCLDKLPYLNKQLKEITGFDETYTSADQELKTFGFKNITHAISTKGEGQLNTGKMMKHLLKYTMSKGVQVLNHVEVTEIDERIVKTNIGNFDCPKIIIATNGFSKKFLPQEDVKPTRAQVLITKPIEDLKVRGIFHMDRGYYYFRNVGNRVLLGGGRHKDMQKEFTDEIALNNQIQEDLIDLLKNVILPDKPFEIDTQWAGIMGMGKEKSPIIKQVNENLICGIRLGGMGVAMGSLIGEELAKMACDN